LAVQYWAYFIIIEFVATQADYMLKIKTHHVEMCLFWTVN